MKTRFQVMENIIGKMEGPTRATGSITICTEKELTSGQTGGCTKESTKMTRSKDSVSTPTQTGDPTADNG